MSTAHDDIYGFSAETLDGATVSLGAYRDKVLLNYERSMAIARPLLEVELDDELTSAPVFRP